MSPLGILLSNCRASKVLKPEFNMRRSKPARSGSRCCKLFQDNVSICFCNLLCIFLISPSIDDSATGATATGVSTFGAASASSSASAALISADLISSAQASDAFISETFSSAARASAA